AVGKLWISDNGYLDFSDEAPGLQHLESQRLDVSGPRPSVAPFWDNLQPRSGLCVAAETASVPKRLFITWYFMCFEKAGGCDAEDDLNFTVALEEGSNKIIFTYGTMRGTPRERAMGSLATIGIADTRTVPRCEATACDLEGLCTKDVACGYNQ